MNKKEIVLNNGVRLLMINTKKFKTVNVTAFFEDKLTHYNLTEDNLLVRLLTLKTSVHTSRQSFKTYLKNLYDMKISSYKDTLGETFSFSISLDSLNKKYSMNGENLLEEQFKVINEVLYKPFTKDNLFDEEYFKEVKNEYKQTLINNENYKEYLVNKKVSEMLGVSNNLFVLSGGYITELERVENASVYSKYCSLHKMCKKIVVIGDINFDEVSAYANKYLSFELVRNNFDYFYKNDFKKYADKEFESKFSQSSIAVLYDLDVYIGDTLYYPTLVFIEMFNYYLFKIVREEYNFCYSIYAVYMASRGLCYLQSNIESKNYDKTLELINNILNDLKNKLDDNVVNICKNKVINGIRKEEDNMVKMAIANYHKDIYGLDDNNEIINKCRNVKISDINEAARKIEKKFSVILKEGQ